MAHIDPDVEVLADLYEEHGARLHRLATMLGAGAAADEVVSRALIALGRRLNRIVDPGDRLDYLHEQLVHLARGARGVDPALRLPEVEDSRQQEVLDGIATLPLRLGEVLLVSHLLSAFGPELARILRLTVRAANARLEEALDALRRIVGGPADVSQPGIIESLSQEVTAALRSSARVIPPPSQDALLEELRTLGAATRHGIPTWLTALLVAVSLVVGAWLATVSAPGRAGVAEPAPTDRPSVPGSVSPSPTSVQSRSLPVQVRGVPIFYVGRKDRTLFRELRDLPAGGDLVAAALGAVISLAPLDPDYMSAWGPGAVLGASITGDLLTVDLTAAAFEGIDTHEQSQAAVNQMLYTASELIGDPALRIRFEMDGAPPPAVFAQPTDGFARAGLSPLAPVWIASPRNGQTLPAGHIVLAGMVKPLAGAPVVAIAAEGGGVVSSVTAQTSTVADQDGWRRWSVAVELNAGTYLITAVTQYESGGGAARAYSDTKSITIS